MILFTGGLIFGVFVTFTLLGIWDIYAQAKWERELKQNSQRSD